MSDLGYEHTQARLPFRFWNNHSDFVLRTVDDLKNLIVEMKLEVEEVVDPLEHLFIYPLPSWLKKEFKVGLRFFS